MTRISMVLFALLGAVLSSASAQADGAPFGPPPGAEKSRWTIPSANTSPPLPT
jgi:hypothetical protein